MMFAGSLRILVPGAGINTEIIGQASTLLVGTPNFGTFRLHFGYIWSIETAAPDRNGACGRAAACETDRNGAYPPDLCFL